MDVMELRRGLMMAMASGADFVKGSFTAPSTNTDGVINFGKAFTKYMFVIEATEESKTSIINSGINANKAFAFCGVYPDFKINNSQISNYHNSFSVRINPSTNEVGQGTMPSSAITATTTSIAMPARAITQNFANYLYGGLTYNYYIVEIK